MLAVIGGDTGPTTGLVLAAWDLGSGELAGCLALECTAAVAPALLGLLLGTPHGRLVRAAGLEKFTARQRSQHLRGVQAARMHDEAGELTAVLTAAGVRVVQRPAAEVKPWATDRRLGAAGLLAPTEKFTDARDAARHALFTACQAGLPDPLSTARARAAGAGSS